MRGEIGLESQLPDLRGEREIRARARASSPCVAPLPTTARLQVDQQPNAGVTISGLQISNGYKVCGGGIINNHELTLRRVVPDNKAVLGATNLHNVGPGLD